MYKEAMLCCLLTNIYAFLLLIELITDYWCMQL